MAVPRGCNSIATTLAAQISIEISLCGVLNVIRHTMFCERSPRQLARVVEENRVPQLRRHFLLLCFGGLIDLGLQRAAPGMRGFMKQHLQASESAVTRVVR